jgi:hypothetical protein
MLASTARVVNHPPLDNWEEAWATKDRCAATGKEPSLSTRKRDLTPCRAAGNRAAQGKDLQRIPLPRGEGGRRPGEGLRVVSDETFRLSVTHKPQADAPHLSRDPPCQAPNARSRGRGQGVGEHQVVVIGRETAGNQVRTHVRSPGSGQFGPKKSPNTFSVHQDKEND